MYLYISRHFLLLTRSKDEVLRSPLTQQDQDQVASSNSHSSTLSCSPPKKKQRLLPSLEQQISPFAPELPTATSAGHGAEPACLEDQYELRIVDYKTRRSPNIPLDEDSLSPRLQLMMYHRMLSSVLTPEAFNFDLLWSRLNLNPTGPFSAQFLKDIQWEQRQVDSADCNVHLNRLVSEWISTVQRKSAGLVGVSQQLQIVYRQSVYVGKRDKEKHKATETVHIDDPLEALVVQEELDLAHAIELSLSEMGQQDAGQLAHLVAQNVKQVGPSNVGRTSAIWKDLISPLDSGQTDPALAWAIQQSLLTCARKAPAQVHANISQQVAAAHGGEPMLEKFNLKLISV